MNEAFIVFRTGILTELYESVDYDIFCHDFINCENAILSNDFLLRTNPEIKVNTNEFNRNCLIYPGPKYKTKFIPLFCTGKGHCIDSRSGLKMYKCDHNCELKECVHINCTKKLPEIFLEHGYCYDCMTKIHLETCEEVGNMTLNDMVNFLTEELSDSKTFIEVITSDGVKFS